MLLNFTNAKVIKKRGNTIESTTFLCYSYVFHVLYLFRQKAIPPMFLLTKLEETPVLHRLCTDFAPTLVRRKSEGSTKVLPFYFLLKMRVIHPPCKRIFPFNIIIKSERGIQNQGKLLDMLTNLCQILLHSVSILMVDDVEKLFQLITNL